MIVPVLTQLRPDHGPDLEFFFKVCGYPYDPEQPFNPDNTLLAFYQGQLVGFVTCWTDGQPYAFVDGLLVHPDFRRTGVGYHLAHAIKGVVMQRGAFAIKCIVTNPELVAILERVGFQRNGVAMEWKNKE